MNEYKLHEIAQKMVAKGKGILAMDESHPTIEKRFKSIGVQSSEASRRSYRSLLLTSPGLGKFTSGVILFDETLRTEATTGKSFVDCLKDEDIVPGIKVDRGAKIFSGHSCEKITEGLDGLGGRLQEYHGLGARFAKWRAVIAIGEGFPSRACMAANAHALARYAAVCQENDMVPIVEPEVLMDGVHSIERCYEVSSVVQQWVFSELKQQNVFLGGMVLKPNMVVSGSGCAEQADTSQVASLTLRCLQDCVPASVPGIAFLSGGLSDLTATENLAAINQLAAGQGGAPWNITFSYGRALQQPALRAWGGNSHHVQAVQNALLVRAEANGNATLGA